MIDHDLIWPENLTFPTIQEPLSRLYADVLSIQGGLVNDIGIEELKDIFENKKSLPGLLFITHSASSVLHYKKIYPTATRLNTMLLFQIDEEKISEQDMAVFTNLNYYMQMAN